MPCEKCIKKIKKLENKWKKKKMAISRYLKKGNKKCL